MFRLTPPILATNEHDPTPAFLTVVGMSSDVHIQSIAKEADAQKLLIMESTTMGISSGYTPLGMNRQATKQMPAMKVKEI